ncbi:hypothetical protein WFZ85_12825 [Flavobacterium sp. j3]|uniref:Uncharacterized protein n=1 Tax=Flavobacterium aureirubrum TaxID=3133147 RepID=A0ABU9N875_9FLAO
MKSKLTKYHLYLLSFLIIHFMIYKLTGYGLNQTIIFSLKIVLSFTGFVLFIFHLKPYKKLSFYFSYYIISPIVMLLGYLFGGVFLVGILLSTLLYPIIPRTIVFEKDDIVIYNKYQDFLGTCCNYEVYQRKYFLFEQYKSEINSEGFDNDSFQVLVEKEINRLKQKGVKN